MLAIRPQQRTGYEMLWLKIPKEENSIVSQVMTARLTERQYMSSLISEVIDLTVKAKERSRLKTWNDSFFKIYGAD